MFTQHKNVMLCIIATVLGVGKCTTDFPPLPPLVLYSPGELESAEIIVRRINDSLLLACELRPTGIEVRYVWNFLPDKNIDGVNHTLDIEPEGLSTASRLRRSRLRLVDSGHYICSAPPYSVSKYVLVQQPGAVSCALGAFSCGMRCVLPAYVCDGRADCARAEDEAVCPAPPCRGPDKLNCSSGRCISLAQCCRAGAPLCRQPACCAERAAPLHGLLDPELPPLDERPDDYGFIQSTIYTVTACALIFMVAVVLLVSAICKLHMKRAALGYAQAQRRTQFAAHRFPPCYEASRLLEERRDPPLHAQSPQSPQTPTSPQLEAAEAEAEAEAEAMQLEVEAGEGGCGEERPSRLARLGAMFTARYRPVQQWSDVEMTSVRCSPRGSPLRSPPLQQLQQLRDLQQLQQLGGLGDLYLTELGGRELNATPLQLHQPRPRLRLSLGRFQLTLPRPRRTAEISSRDLDFLRLDENETYTLNGRTIRLLGASFENYPPPAAAPRPPPYSELRLKHGPPPEYLSRDTLVETPGSGDGEQPPGYEDLEAENNNVTAVSQAGTQLTVGDGAPSLNLTGDFDNLPAIDSDVNANEQLREGVGNNN